MRRSILAATTLAVLATAALAQNSLAPMEKPAAGSPQNGGDAMTDVDPEVLA
jgi:hypothetical protein